MRTLIGRWAALGVGVALAMLVLAAPAMAEDAAPANTGGGIARPSVEELAIPLDDKSGAQNAAATGRETDTREAMCLMIESAARANDLPLGVFARVLWEERRL